MPSLQLLIITILQKPNRYFLLLIKYAFKYIDRSIKLLFFTFSDQLLDAALAVHTEQIPLAQVLFVLFYLASMLFVKVCLKNISKQCSVQLKTRFNK